MTPRHQVLRPRNRFCTGFAAGCGRLLMYCQMLWSKQARSFMDRKGTTTFSRRMISCTPQLIRYARGLSLPITFLALTRQLLILIDNGSNRAFDFHFPFRLVPGGFPIGLAVEHRGNQSTDRKPPETDCIGRHNRRCSVLERSCGAPCSAYRAHFGRPSP